VRIVVADASRATALRDYVLRLGGEAVLGAGDVVEVTHAPDGEELSAYVESWSAINGVPTQLVTPPPPAPTRVSDPAGAPPPRLGDLLVARGWITRDQLSEALFESRSSGDLLGRVLLSRGWIFEEELARTLAGQWALPYVSLMRIGANPEVVRLLPKAIGLRFAAVPVRLQGFGVQVAFADPSDHQALEAVQEHLPSITLAVADLSDIEAVWKGVPA
jgi:hypothetical protein